MASLSATNSVYNDIMTGEISKIKITSFYIFVLIFVITVRLNSYNLTIVLEDIDLFTSHVLVRS